MVQKRHIQNQVIVTNLRRNQEMCGGLHRWHPLPNLPGSPDQTTWVLASGCLNASIWVYTPRGACQHQHMGTRVWVWVKFCQFHIISPSPLYGLALIFARSLLVLQHYFLQMYGKFWLSNNFVCCYESAITLTPACNEHRQVPAQFASKTDTKRSYTSKPIMCLFNCTGFARLSFLPIKYKKR